MIRINSTRILFINCQYQVSNIATKCWCIDVLILNINCYVIKKKHNIPVIVGRLISLNKCPGVQSVRVGETWQLMLAKCMWAVKGSEAKEACRTEKLFRGLESGIEGGVQVSTEAHPGGKLGVYPHWHAQYVKSWEMNSHAAGGATQVAQWCAVCI